MYLVMCAFVHSVKSLVAVLRLFCAACDRRDNTPFPCLNIFPDMADIRTHKQLWLYHCLHLPSKGLRTVLLSLSEILRSHLHTEVLPDLRGYLGWVAWETLFGFQLYTLPCD